MRPIALVDTKLFYEWAKSFVDETKMLRSIGERVLLIMDGYSSHIAFRALKLLAENGIIVACLSAHTSYVLQPLDASIFGPMKEAFRRLLSRITIITNKGKRNDIFTIF